MILAQRLERPAAVGADGRVRLMNLNVARQVGREGARGRRGRGSGAGTGWLDPRLGFGRAGFQRFQLEFELSEERPRAFRPTPELPAAQLGDPEFQVGDFGLLTRDFHPLAGDQRLELGMSSGRSSVAIMRPV